MEKYDVSFEICTKSIGLDTLSSLIGLDCAMDSHEMGEPRGKGVWEETYWKLFSTQSGEATIFEHFEDVLSQLGRSNILKPESRSLFPEDCSFYLSVAVFFDENLESELFEISPEIVGRINEYELEVEVCFYRSRIEKS